MTISNADCVLCMVPTALQLHSHHYLLYTTYTGFSLEYKVTWGKEARNDKAEPVQRGCWATWLNKPEGGQMTRQDMWCRKSQFYTTKRRDRTGHEATQQDQTTGIHWALVPMWNLEIFFSTNNPSFPHLCVQLHILNTRLMFSSQLPMWSDCFIEFCSKKQTLTVRDVLFKHLTRHLFPILKSTKPQKVYMNIIVHPISAASCMTE